MRRWGAKQSAWSFRCARGYGEKSRREYAHAVVHLGRVLHEAQGEAPARVLDETIIEEFIRGHLPFCCCYWQRPGRQAVHVQRGLAHLLAMLREEGTIPSPVSVEPIYHELLKGYCRFLRDDRGLASLHDLRATFAVTRLLEWYRDGDNVMNRLPLLSTYLGHACVGDTEVYLRITTALLEQANTRFHAFARDVLPPGGGS
jgi:hypothetical protein